MLACFGRQGGLCVPGSAIVSCRCWVSGSRGWVLCHCPVYLETSNGLSPGRISCPFPEGTRAFFFFLFPFSTIPAAVNLLLCPLGYGVCCLFPGGLNLSLFRGTAKALCVFVQGLPLPVSWPVTPRRLCPVDFSCTWWVLCTLCVHGEVSSGCKMPCVCDP